jgi:hypothetical protein
MSLLLPRTVPATVHAVRPLDIHGDRYVDVQLELDDEPGALRAARIAASECPADLAPGDRVEARFTMGVLVRLARA